MLKCLAVSWSSFETTRPWTRRGLGGPHLKASLGRKIEGKQTVLIPKCPPTFLQPGTSLALGRVPARSQGTRAIGGSRRLRPGPRWGSADGGAAGPARRSPPPAPRAALWVARGRQVTANGGGRLSRRAARHGSAAGPSGLRSPLAAACPGRRARRAMDRPVAAAAAAGSEGGGGPGPAGGRRPPRGAGGPVAGSRQPSVETLDR